eukprot:746239-Hanusia_phi.AAC.9
MEEESDEEPEHGHEHGHCESPMLVLFADDVGSAHDHGHGECHECHGACPRVAIDPLTNHQVTTMTAQPRRSRRDQLISRA